MTTNNIVSVIDAEIAKLKEARSILSGYTDPTNKRGPGRPKKSVQPVAKKAVKRTLSAAARARIAEAQRKRWAAAKKAVK